MKHRVIWHNVGLHTNTQVVDVFVFLDQRLVENQKIKKAWFTSHFWGLSTRFILIIYIYEYMFHLQYIILIKFHYVGMWEHGMALSTFENWITLTAGCFRVSAPHIL